MVVQPWSLVLLFSSADPCSAETPPCLHGGTCTAKDEPPFYECDCINGYTGDTCDTRKIYFAFIIYL